MIASDPTYPLFSVFSFVGFVIALIPLPWHLQAWNSGTCFYMIWASLSSLNLFINSVVWANTALNVAPIWCDISTRIIIGASVGIPAASLCINRRLYEIARIHAVMVTAAEKRRAFLIDTLICVLFPCICMALAYIVQGHRFNVYEEIGCYPAIYNTLPAYFLVYMWPVVIGLVSVVYCTLSLKALFKRRSEFQKFLASGSGLTSSRYFRLMALSMTEIIFTVPFGVYELYSNAAGGALEPWKGWDDTHYDFSRVVLYPSAIWKMDPSLAVPIDLSRWIVALCAFVFFAFFGFAEEARRNYAKVYKPIREYFCASTKNDPSYIKKGLGFNLFPSPSSMSLPVYSPPSLSTAPVTSPGWTVSDEEDKKTIRDDAPPGSPHSLLSIDSHPYQRP